VVRFCTDGCANRTPATIELLAGMRDDLGSILMGRRSYDLAEGDGGWGEDGPAGRAPCFVLTHEPPAPQTVRAPTVFTLVTDGIHDAFEQAKAAAGAKVVAVNGASAAQQCLAAGLMDEIQIHLVPVLLGSGTQAVRTSRRPVPAPTHHGRPDTERHPPALPSNPPSSYQPLRRPASAAGDNHLLLLMPGWVKGA
jgi:dihydrofolate reductase